MTTQAAPVTTQAAPVTTQVALGATRLERQALGGGGEGGSGGSTAPGGSAQGGSSATGGMAAGGQGGAPGTGGLPMGGMTMGTGGMPVASSFPCKVNCKVLFVGDGLAAGTGSGANGADGVGFRTQLKNALGAPFTLVGAAGTPPHEGMKGRTVAALMAALPGFVMTHKPDLVIINIGSEDAKASIANLTAPKVMALVDKVVELAPNAGVVVTSPPPFQMSQSDLVKLQKFGSDLGKLVQAASVSKKHVAFVGLSSMFIKYVGGPADPEFLSPTSPPYPNVRGYNALGGAIVVRAVNLMKP